MRLVVALLLSVVGTTALACPGAFDDYLSRFRKSRSAQEQGAWYPLRVYGPSGDRCYPDCDIVAYDYNKSDIRAQPEALFPLPAEVRERGMTIRKTTRGDRATVRVYIEESDAFYGTYVFRRIKGCWYLIQVN